MTRYLLAFLAGLLAVPGAAMAAPAPADELNSTFKPMLWRSIGPFRGGRSVASTGVIGDPRTYYMGTTGGGLWKTEDMGLSWHNVSDGYFQSGSIGAVAVAASDPNVVYVGTGEHAVRGVMTHGGDGLWRSTDAGRSWKRIGLEQSQHIARIIVHPQDPDTVWVAVQGALYGPSSQRGVYKSTDGGANWTQVLSVDERTGASELSLDPGNPRILYAAMWEHGRQPWKITSGGPGSGLYKSTDSGDTWERLSEGLPEKMGKMAIAVSPVNNDKVWALIESDSNEDERGLYVSLDAGKHWKHVSSEPRLVQRAWYYIEVFPDPEREDTVYVMSAPALRSDDDGKTWVDMDAPHGDFHDLWINPDDRDNFIISSDGGASITFDGGESWSSQENMPTAQLYRVNVDNQFPYRLYAGQQDNTSVSIASREFASYGIGPTSWEPSAGGESAFLAFDPDQPRYVMGGSYQGTIQVIDTQATAGTNIMAAPIQYLAMDAKDMKYRYNWNAPIVWSPQEKAFFHGAQHLLKTTDMGKTWREISPDLTRNNKATQGTPGGPYTNEGVGAENYGTLAYVALSPHEKGVIWTGSDDGLVHLTRDGGATWKNVTPPKLAECLVNAIEISPFDAGTAYIATTRYKFNDHAPGLYKTTDYGASWTRIDRGIPAGAFTRVVREDEVRRDLLYAGTERGLFLSWNGGKDWQPFQLNLPLTPITDLRVHQGNLIAATSGRSFWILDDLSLVRQYQPQRPDFALYQPGNAWLVNSGSQLDQPDATFTGADTFLGVNPASGIVLYYQLPELDKADELTLQVADAAGKVIRTYSSKAVEGARKWDGGPSPDPLLPKARGLNRFVWDLRHPTLPGVPDVYFEASWAGHRAPPGRYRFTLRLKERSLSTAAEILPNPLYPTDAETYQAHHALMSELEAALRLMLERVNALHDKREQLAALLKQLPADARLAKVREQGEALEAKLKAWDEDMVQRKTRAYDDTENYPNKFTAHYFFLLNHAESDIPQVNASTQERRAELDAQWAALKARSDELIERDIPAFNTLLWEAGVGAIWK